MDAPTVRNDFKKAAGDVALTAGTALADAHRVMDTASIFKRGKTKRELRLAAEFCQLLIKPVNERGPTSLEDPGFAETYCRKHMSLATDFCMQAMETHDLGSPECTRLFYIAGLIEETLKKYLDEETAETCWFGDRLPLVRELQAFGSLNLG